MEDHAEQPDSGTLPRAEDGFHEPTASTKRRNLLTALLILAFLTGWCLMGLRHALFGS